MGQTELRKKKISLTKRVRQCRFVQKTRAVLRLELADSLKPPPGTSCRFLTRECRKRRVSAGVTGFSGMFGWVGVGRGAVGSVAAWVRRQRCRDEWLKSGQFTVGWPGPVREVEEEEERPRCASQAEERRGGVLGSFLYLRKFPPPISLLYLLVRLSACSVSLESTPNRPLRW